MHFAIVGPGALGCLIASIIHRGKKETDTVSLLDYNRERADRINTQGIVYFHSDKKAVFPVKAFTAPEQLGTPDVIMLCVKSYDLEKTLALCNTIFHHNPVLLFLQNGVSHLDYDQLTGNAITAFGTTTEGATSIGPGQVRHAGQGKTYLGYKNPDNAASDIRLEQIADRLTRGGATAQCSQSIRKHIWLKLFINIGINALTVIHDCPNGELTHKPEAQKTMKAALDEAALVVQKERIQVTPSLDDVLSVCRSTATNISSMLQDIRNGRKTEIDAINGAIVQLGQYHAIDTPVNRTLVTHVKNREKKAYNEHTP